MNILRRLRINHALYTTSFALIGWIFSGFQVNSEFLILMVSLFFFNIFAFVYNDFIDAPFDAKDNHKSKRNIFCDKKNLKFGKTISVFLIIFVLVTALFVNTQYFFLLLIMLSLMVLYSGPVFRAKSRPFFDVLFHATWAVLVFFAGYYYFFSYSIGLILGSILIFLLSSIQEIGQEIRDFTIDKETNQKTSVQVLGLKNSIILIKGIIYIIHIILTLGFLFMNHSLLSIISITIPLLNIFKIIDFKKSFGKLWSTLTLSLMLLFISLF
ncbi:MAG: UbiA family prenyltransferase [Nanoarchaeota archaeon]|nr:UbiA family prenyltransferase [Nanoarchaeota archaeon]